MFDLLNHKSLVTTDITDGRKISLGISKQEKEEIELEEVAKDGTITGGSAQNKQARMD